MNLSTMAIVDIIIPLYNKEATIARAVQSVLEQTFADWRLIIVDDGSTDNGLQTARRFTDPRIQIIEQENHGPGAARNRGIQAASAKYIAFLDADDQWYSWYLENSLKAFESDTVSFVGSMYDEWPAQGDMTTFWAKRNVTPGKFQAQGHEKPKDILSLLFFFHVGNSIVRTEIARRYDGFYDAEKCLLGEDTVFFAKLMLNEKFMIIGPSAVRHNRQDSELSNNKNQPLDIFLRKPEIVLDYCLDKNRAFAEKVLAYHAMRVAHFRARNGNKTDAIYLRNKFPRMQRFGFHYHKLCIEIKLSRFLPCWVRFKCTMCRPIRLFLERIASRIKSF